MNRINTLLIAITLMVAGAANVSAKHLTKAEAISRMQSENTTAAKGMRAASADALQLVYAATENGETNVADDNADALLYVFNNTRSGGFVIASADDLAPAVLAYGAEPFDADNMAPATRYWLEQYAAAIREAVETQTPLTIYRAAQNPVEPLIKTRWRQSEPYNSVCVEKTGNSQAIAGCVATAMAQVMAYYIYPKTGTGSHSYVTDTLKYSLSADFGATTYDWDNMKLTYGTYYQYNASENKNYSYYSDYNATQVHAVAELMYQAGVSVNMNYMNNNSGAKAFNIAPALINYFGYDKRIRFRQKENFTDEEWLDIINGELQQQRPVIFGADKSSGGHQFICDGYDGNGYYHINWGWNGLDDAYYLIVGPKALNDDHTDVDNAGYVYDQSITYNIYPDQGSKYADHDVCLVQQSQANVCQIVNGTLTPVTALDRNSTYQLKGAFINFSFYTDTLNIGVEYVNTATGESYFDYSSRGVFESRRGTTSYSISPACVEKDGTYQVYPIFCQVDKDVNVRANWQRMLPYVAGTVPQVTISGSQPDIVVNKAYINREDNIATLNRLKLNIDLTANTAITNHEIVVWVYDASNPGSSNVGFYSTRFTATAGKSVSTQLSYSDNTNNAADIKEGGLYSVEIQDYTSKAWLTPLRKAMFYVKVLSEQDYITGIADVTTSSAATAAPTAIYSLDGMRLPKAQKGLNIIRQADGSVRKVILR